MNAAVFCVTAFYLVLVSRNAGIYLQAPTVDAAGHALARIDALLAEPVNRMQASDAVMAKHDERRFVGLGVQAREFGGYGSHGDQFRAADARELEFCRLTDIDERELFARV